MKVFILSGLGPEVKYEDMFALTALALQGNNQNQRQIGSEILNWIYTSDKKSIPLLRPRKSKQPCLSTALVCDLFKRSGCEVISEDLASVWSKNAPVGDISDIEMVAISTTFICNSANLDLVMTWVQNYFGGLPVVVGGQFSNLKSRDILANYPKVSCVVRGDGEVSIPRLIDAYRGRAEIGNIPNIVARNPTTGQIISPPLTYCDLNAGELVSFSSDFEIAAYESMRGCPFLCGFCSFPAASPRLAFVFLYFRR